MMLVCVVSAVLVLLAAVPAQAVQAAQADSALLRTIQRLNFTKLLNASRDVLPRQCENDLESYFMSIGKAKLWALQMLDSSAKIPEAVLWGNMYFMGMFDECVAVAAGPDHDFMGQHCLLRISAKETPGALTPLPLVYRYGLCVPSSCAPRDLQAAFTHGLQLAHIDDQVQVLLGGNDCSTGEAEGLNTSDMVFVSLLVVLCTVAVCSTIYERFEVERNARPHPVLSSFSLYSNLKSLMAVSKGPMDSLHGLRTLSMAWVVLCHAYNINVRALPNSNLREVLPLLTNAAHMPVMNGFLCVDSFLFLSGLLVCFVFFRETAKNGAFDVPAAYLHRYLRLTPPLAAILLLQVTILLRVGDGPLWKQAAHDTARVCDQSWWSTLLYVQNYVYPEAPCLGQTWYLAADMQMFWFSPIVLYPLYLWPVAGAVWLGVVTLGAVGMNFGIAYANALGPSIFLTSNPDQYKIDYLTMHNRITPWLVGVAVGYVICGLKARKVQVRLSKAVVALGWLLTTAVCLSIVYTYKVFLDSGYNRLEGAFYLSLHRLGWGLGLAWVVFACVHGYGGPVNAFLSWSAFQPLAKLSYCTYLIHLSIQMYRSGIVRVNQYFTDTESVYLYLGDVVVATLLAIPFSLIFEMPFNTLDRFYLRDTKILPLPRSKPRAVAMEERVEAGPSAGTDNTGFVKTETTE